MFGSFEMKCKLHLFFRHQIGTFLLLFFGNMDFGSFTGFKWTKSEFFVDK